MFEVFAFLIAILVLAIPVVMLALVIVAFVRTQRIADLQRRIESLEARLRPQPEPAAALPPTAAPPIVPVEVVAEPGSPFAADAARPASSHGWEFTLGRNVLGWVAVVALVLATATFLKYAFDNQWIGPQGQLALVLAGGLCVAGAAYRFAAKGWRKFAQFLFSAALVVLYLGTYGSFGFFHVVSQEIGLAFLLILVVEAALLAVVYEAWPMALVALLGGLATPLLISSPRDEYLSLFAYLLLLNGGALSILSRREWPALATVALLGAQGLFVLWFERFFHPEKLAWALGFQALLWGFHVAYHVLAFVAGRRTAGVEDLVRLLLVPLVGFAQVYRLLSPEYSPWLGSIAVALGIVYAGLAHVAYRMRPDEERGLLALLAVVLGLVGIAIPLEAEANWVALGWAVMGAALWWFGLRVERGVLRGMGATLGILAVGRLIFETPYGPREPFWLLLNEYALPSLGVVGCVLGSVMLVWNNRGRLLPGERTLTIIAGVAAAVLLGWIVSWDLYGWFDVQARLSGNHDWHWAGQVAVSAWWAAYATALLAVGFWAHRPIARWMALGLFALTTLKVFIVDMSSVGGLYRVFALFCLSLLLAGAAWAYQRARVRLQATTPA